MVPDPLSIEPCFSAASMFGVHNELLGTGWQFDLEQIRLRFTLYTSPDEQWMIVDSDSNSDGGQGTGSAEGYD